MPRKKTAKSTRPKAPAPRKKPAAKAKAEPKLPQGATRKLVLAGAGVLLAAGVVIGAGVGIPALGRNAAARISTENRTVQIWLTRPEWMPQQAFDAVMDKAVFAYEQTSRELGPTEAISAEPLRAVQQAMATTGWAADTPRVVRKQPTREPEAHQDTRRNDVHIQMAWRRPVAAVRSSAFQAGARPGLRDTAIDANADVLPMSGPPESFPGLRVILNPSRMPTQRDAADTNPSWPGQDVRDAIALFNLLQAEPFNNQIVGVDLAEHADGRRLLIVTTTGGRIVWGMPPGAPGFERGEVGDQNKLANLRSLVQATGYLDGGQERVEIHWPGTVLIGDRGAREGRGGAP